MQIHVRDVPSTRFEPLPGQEGDPDVRFLVTGQQAGTPVCLFRCVFPPGALHGIHRHPGADEFVYIVSGCAAAGEGDEEREAPAGTVIYTPRDEVHWLRNLSESEDVELFGGFAGVPDLEAAGYKFVGEISAAHRQLASRP